MVYQPSAPLGIIDDFQFHQKAVVGMGLLGIYGLSACKGQDNSVLTVCFFGIDRIDEQGGTERKVYFAARIRLGAFPSFVCA